MGHLQVTCLTPPANIFLDVDALEDYLVAAEPTGISPPPLTRINVVP